jgi:hypothetical protein
MRKFLHIPLAAAAVLAAPVVCLPVFCAPPAEAQVAPGTTGLGLPQQQSLPNPQTNPQTTGTQTTGTQTTGTQSTSPAGSQAPATTPKPLPKVDPSTLPSSDAPLDAKTQKKLDADKTRKQAINDSMPSPGEDLDPHIKPGSEEDVNAIGTRNIGGRGLGNWYSTDWEIRVGKQYSMEIEKSAHLVTDPVIVEYVNRIGQNLVKNSDAKVPFTIKVIDSDEINAMALPGGFFYVNTGLITACDDEAELAGVMAHEISHVVAHHAARQQTKGNYATIASIPLIIMAQGSYAAYGAYEASQLAIPLTFLKFSRMDEAEADYLGVQYMYKAGYDPQSFVTLFEKLDSLEKHKPGTLAKAFADHPQTPDRIAASEDEIATILPPRPDYVVTTSEFDDVKARLARLENKRKINDKNGGNKPTLRRAGSSNNPNSTSTTNTGDDRPTLGRH